MIDYDCMNYKYLIVKFKLLSQFSSSYAESK